MAHKVDLRSDTVTKPTEAMKHAMVNSALGDDVFREDPTVNALEMKIATMCGKQAALFVPSGTMANLIASGISNPSANIRPLLDIGLSQSTIHYPILGHPHPTATGDVMVHCKKRGSEVLVGNKSHIFKYEQGGAAHVGGVQLTTLQNKPDGTFDLDEFEGLVRGSDVHEPITSLVAIENTHNYCGGKVLPLNWLDDLAARAKKRSIPIHMDGARVFNACEYLKQPISRLVRDCDSVSICFSKGLSCPVGSTLVGSYHFIEQARRVRKMLGGGMRQAGVLAAAAIVALEEIVPNLGVDHRRAQILATTIKSLGLKNFDVDVKNTQTNIVLLTIPQSSPITADGITQRLAQVSLSETKGDCKTEAGDGIIVNAIIFNNKTIRFTLHCDIDDENLWLAIMKITYVLREFEADANKKL